MAHSIRAFIGKSTVFQQPWLNCPIASVSLAQNMRLVPVTHELWEQIHVDAIKIPKRARIRVSGWRQRERDFFLRLSQGGAIAFIETEYFGGSGNQGAIVARHGEITFGPRVAPSGVINQALRCLSISKSGNVFDEFDALGLGRFRDNVHIIRAFLLRNWMRAWFVFPESHIEELQTIATSVSKPKVTRAPSGLYFCPSANSEDNPIEEFLMEQCDAMHDFELSQADFWWINEFFKTTRGIDLIPRRRHPQAVHLKKQTDVPFICWTSKNAELACSTLAGGEERHRDFARFKPQAYDSSPPQPLAERYDQIIGFLRSYFESVTPGSIGILVDL